MDKSTQSKSKDQQKPSDITGVLGLLSNINPLSSHQENINKRLLDIKSIKARANARRTLAEKFADGMTSKFGSVFFLSINALWFAVWIAANNGWIPRVEPFDPFPFGLLTMVVSLEAIFLAIIVLISQNREARVGEIREEIQLQVSTISESEVTKLIHLMSILLEKQGVDIDKDPELKKMLKRVNNEEIEQEVERELSQ